jgi:hypothetical protein
MIQIKKIMLIGLAVLFTVTILSSVGFADSTGREDPPPPEPPRQIGKDTENKGVKLEGEAFLEFMRLVPGSPDNPQGVRALLILRKGNEDRIFHAEIGVMSNDALLTFADAGGAGDDGVDEDTITRNAGGSWIDDGFNDGDEIVVTGSLNNNSTFLSPFTIKTVTDLTLTLTADGGELAPEGPTPTGEVSVFVKYDLLEPGFSLLDLIREAMKDQVADPVTGFDLGAVASLVFKIKSEVLVSTRDLLNIAEPEPRTSVIVHCINNALSCFSRFSVLAVQVTVEEIGP